MRYRMSSRDRWLPVSFNVEILVEQLRVNCRQAIDSNEEHRFKLQPLDVLDVKNTDIVVLAHDLPRFGQATTCAFSAAKASFSASASG